jgi:hypothetical protein
MILSLSQQYFTLGNVFNRGSQRDVVFSAVTKKVARVPQGRGLSWSIFVAAKIKRQVKGTVRRD